MDVIGKVCERLKQVVLKTTLPDEERGFESLPYRQTVTWVRGLNRKPAKFLLLNWGRRFESFRCRHFSVDTDNKLCIMKL